MMQIFTSAKKDGNGFLCERVHFFNFVEVERFSGFIGNVSQMQADIINLKAALQYVINDDAKFGGCEKISETFDTWDYRLKQIYSVKKVSKGVYYSLPLKQTPPEKQLRFAVCYTENELLLRYIRFTFASEFAEHASELFRLSQTHGITINIGSVKAMDDKFNVNQLKQLFGLVPFSSSLFLDKKAKVIPYD